MMNIDNINDREAACKIVSKYFSSDLVMDKSSKEITIKEQSTSKNPQAKSEKSRKRSNKKIKGQKDIRTLIKSKKNELLKYNKDFDFVCKQSGIDIDPQQLQIAIALSKSLQENKSENDDGTIKEKSLTCNQRRNKIRLTLKEYGFETKKSPIKKVKKYRKQYKLLLVPHTEKLQQIGDKYAQILIQSFKIYKTSYEKLPYFDNTKSFLYNLTTNVSYDCIKNDDVYYVDELLTKSLHVKHIFKDWSKIPGRPVSPELVRPDILIKNFECTQEELDNILSGSVKTAQDIVNSINKVQSKEVEKIAITENDVHFINSLNSNIEDGITQVVSENTTNQDSLAKSSIEILCNMTQPINRSCSPNLFDDEVTIIMDTSKHIVSERTMTNKDQNEVMDLTECVGITNYNNTISNQYGLLSQAKNSTKRNSNDFMDLTQCVTSSSHTKSHNVHNSCGYIKENSSSAKENNKNIAKDDSSNFSKNIPSITHGHEKSLNDTVIMIDEEFNKIIPSINCNVVSSNDTGKTVLIDLVGEQYQSSKTHNTVITNDNSIIDLDQSFESNMDKNLTTTIANQNIKTNAPNNKIPERNKTPDTMDLTQANDYEDCLSFAPRNSINSIITCEIPLESDSISISTENKAQHSKNFGDKMDHENEYNQIKESDNFEEMDLTQSSNSEEGLPNDVYINNKLDKDYNVNDLVINNLKKHRRDYIDIEKDHAFQNVNLANSYQSNINVEIANGKSSNYLENCSIENTGNFRELHLNQHSNFSSDKVWGPNDVINDLPNMNDDSHITEDEGKHYEICKFIKKSDDKTSNSRINKSNECITDFGNVIEHVPNDIQCVLETSNLSSRNENSPQFRSNNTVEFDTVIYDQNSDIDLTQQSDSSGHSLNNPEIIDLPDELGKQNNISIDYDELCAEPKLFDLSKECETIPALDVCGITESDNIFKEKDASGTSQHSEVFEISDDEFNYSIKQHEQDNGSLILKPTEFDIGGISTIDNILSQDSLARRSKLRCSCSFNTDTADNKVENCLSVTLRSNENFVLNNVNKESKSCEEVEFVKISTPVKSKSDNNILIAKTPKHDDYVIKTDQVTPMPNYEKMTSPERNEELDKFGIKPLKRKRAIQLLTHIYNQTHPLMEVISEAEECMSPSKKRRKNYDLQSLPTRNIASDIDSTWVTNSPEVNDPILHVVEANLSQNPSKSCKELSQNVKKSPKKTQVASKSSYSNKENVLYEVTTLPIIRNIECCPEDWIFQKREKAKVHSCRVPLHIAFHNYVSSQTALHEAILRYEPVNIDDIHKGLVAVGYRYNPKDLLKFMDKKCITVKTAENARKNKNP